MDMNLLKGTVADPEDPYFLSLLNPDPQSEVRLRIRVLLSSSKNSKKILDSSFFVISL